MRSAIGEISDDDYCPGQNDRGVRTHKTNLHVANSITKLDHDPPQAMNQAVDNANVENLPQPFTRDYQNGTDNRRIVNLINVVFVFEQPRHSEQGLLPEHEPAN